MVTVIIEEGGGGAAVAAPVGIDVLGTLLYADKGYYSSADMGKIAGSTGKVVERKDEELDTGIKTECKEIDIWELMKKGEEKFIRHDKEIDKKELDNLQEKENKNK